MSGAVEPGIEAAEQRRIRAINGRDWAALRDVLADDFSYRHSRGQVDDREHWIAHIDAYPSYTTERETIRIDRYGDVAVVTGVLRNAIVRDPQAPATTSIVDAVQIWSLVDGAWRQRAHHSFKNPH